MANFEARLPLTARGGSVATPGAAMDPTVLQVTCGSCMNQVNVPASLLDGLLRAKKFKCPHCGSSQEVGPGAS